jgi:hypothetical protein
LACKGHKQALSLTCTEPVPVDLADSRRFDYGGHGPLGIEDRLAFGRCAVLIAAQA